MNTYQKIACSLLCIWSTFHIHTAPPKPAGPAEQELAEVDPTTKMLRDTKKRLDACTIKFEAIKKTTDPAQQANLLKEVIDILCKDIPSDLITRIKNAESSEKTISLKDTITKLELDVKSSEKRRDNEKEKAEKETFKTIDKVIKENRTLSSAAVLASLSTLFETAQGFSKQLASLDAANRTPIAEEKNPSEIKKFYLKIKSAVPKQATQFGLEDSSLLSIALESLWGLMATIDAITIFNRTQTPGAIPAISEELKQQIDKLSELKWPQLPDGTQEGPTLHSSIVEYIKSIDTLAKKIAQIQESFRTTNQTIKTLTIGS